MRNAVPVLGIIAAALTVALANAGEEQKTPVRPRVLAKMAARREARVADEKAIRQAVETFSKNYNAHDAAAIASQFAEDGSIAGEEGSVAKGRKAIQETFAEVFKLHPNTSIENTIESLRFVSPVEAIESGITTVVYQKDAAGEKNRYQVVHKKVDGTWQMASAVELPEDSWTGEGPLSQLESLVGCWIDESPDAVVLTSYAWGENHRFLIGHFTIQIAGKPAMTGVQRIGWDPLLKAIRSWVFDSEGGFVEGVWTREGDQWKAKMTGVTPEGKVASSSQLLAFDGDDRMTFQIVDRTIGEEKLPDGQKVVIVRRAPMPTQK